MSKWEFSKISENILEKVKQNNFYFGLFLHKNTTYGYDWVTKLIEIETGEICSSSSPKCHIPNQLKIQVWDKYIGKDTAIAKCYCCRKTEIRSRTFTAGHVLSEKDGGKTTVENLRPICSICNLSMKTMHMRDYIEKCFPENISKFDKNKAPLLKAKWFR